MCASLCSRGAAAGALEVSDAAARPLITSLPRPSSRGASEAARAVGRLAANSGRGRQVLLDKGILAPLTRLLHGGWTADGGVERGGQRGEGGGGSAGGGSAGEASAGAISGSSVPAASSVDPHVQTDAANAVRQLSSISGVRRDLFAAPDVMRALIGGALELYRRPAVGVASLWSLSNACAGMGAMRVLLGEASRSARLLEVMRLHAPPLSGGHMPCAMLILHLATALVPPPPPPESEGEDGSGGGCGGGGRGGARGGLGGSHANNGGSTPPLDAADADADADAFPMHDYAAVAPPPSFDSTLALIAPTAATASGGGSPMLASHAIAAASARADRRADRRQLHTLRIALVRALGALLEESARRVSGMPPPPSAPATPAKGGGGGGGAHPPSPSSTTSSTLARADPATPPAGGASSSRSRPPRKRGARTPRDGTPVGGSNSHGAPPTPATSSLSTPSSTLLAPPRPSTDSTEPIIDDSLPATPPPPPALVSAGPTQVETSQEAEDYAAICQPLCRSAALLAAVAWPPRRTASQPSPPLPPAAVAEEEEEEEEEEG